MLTIDGAQGEGGGQILRSALALALVTGTPFRIENVRAGRKKPGLLRQHLTAVRAAAEIGAEVSGAELGACELTVRPGRVRGGEYRFAVGTAGSACLVLQTVLPPLLLADAPSTLVLEGGTHNPQAPTWDYLARVFLPVLARMGAVVRTALERHGFHPAGGGRIRVEIEPVKRLEPLALLERGDIRTRRARAILAHLPADIGKRELRVVDDKLSGFRDGEIEAVESAGPGNVLLVSFDTEHVTEMFTGFGERGVRAENVAHAVIAEARRYLLSDAPVGTHLADQLILPLALAGGGAFRTLPLTAHAETNIEVVRRFLPVDFTCTREANDSVRVEATAR